MLAWNPKFLWYDAGFQLSFLAVVGIAEIAVPLKDSIPLPPVFGEAILATIAAQIMTAPLLMVIFGSFSLIAPVANALVSLVIPASMLLGFLGTMVSILSFPLGQLVAFLAFGCLEFIIRTAEIPVCYSIRVHSGADIREMVFAFELCNSFWIIDFLAKTQAAAFAKNDAGRQAGKTRSYIQSYY